MKRERQEAGTFLRYLQMAVNQVTITLHWKGGVAQIPAWKAGDKVPFRPFLKSKDAGEESEILVYPKILDMKELLRETEVNEGELESSIKGRGPDLYGLRGYISGDDRRAIHWKTSARLSKLYIREFAREDVRKVTLVLDDCIPDGFEESLEKGIVIAASLASHFLLGKGYQVGLVTSGEVSHLG